jgi:hypothetical protein
VTKREVKEEPKYAMQTAIRRCGISGGGITIREPVRQQQRRAGGALLVPKPEVQEELDNQEAAKAAKMAEYERRRRLIASSNDPEYIPELHTVFMVSLNDKEGWRGDIDTAISMSIRDSGMPLVDLTNNGEVGPSGVVNDEPADEPDERGKKDVVYDSMYNFHQYYDPSGRRKFYYISVRSKFHRISSKFM